jgi:integrase/recombinase XerC
MWVEWSGNPQVVEVTAADVEGFVRRVRTNGKTGSASTIGRDVGMVKSFYEWAVAQQWVDHNPAAGVHGPTRRHRQPRPVADSVWKQWWESDLPPGLRVCLGLGFYGGLRRAEMVSLQAKQFRDGKIVNFVRKGGGEHSLPLRDMTEIVVDRLGGVVGDPKLFWHELDAARRAGGKLVRWRVDGPDEVNRRIKRWQHRMELPPVTPHQLRHSCASNLVRSSVPIHLVSSLMNHNNVQTTMGYVSSGGEQLTEWKRQLT